MQIGDKVHCRYRGELTVIDVLGKGKFVVTNSHEEWEQKEEDLGKLLSFIDSTDTTHEESNDPGLHYDESKQEKLRSRFVERVKSDQLERIFDNESDRLKLLHGQLVLDAKEHLTRKQQIEKEIATMVCHNREEMLQKKDMIRDKFRYDESVNRVREIHESPYFGRVDLQPENGKSNPYYIGKKGYTSKEFEIMDWRGDLAGIFYQKQQMKFQQKGYVYEVMGRYNYDIKSCLLENLYANVATHENNVYDEFLIDVLEKKRGTKGITDIIESIQRQQYELVTSPANRSMIVQGCAGSGKTMIMYHRISYMLFNELIKEKGTWIITPNSRFREQLKNLSVTLEVDKIQQEEMEDFLNEIASYYDKSLSVRRDDIYQVTNHEMIDYMAYLKSADMRVLESVPKDVAEYLKSIGRLSVTTFNSVDDEFHFLTQTFLSLIATEDRRRVLMHEKRENIKAYFAQLGIMHLDERLYPYLMGKVFQFETENELVQEEMGYENQSEYISAMKRFQEHLDQVRQIEESVIIESPTSENQIYQLIEEILDVPDGKAYREFLVKKSEVFEQYIRRQKNIDQINSLLEDLELWKLKLVPPIGVAYEKVVTHNSQETVEKWLLMHDVIESRITHTKTRSLSEEWKKDGYFLLPVDIDSQIRELSKRVEMMRDKHTQGLIDEYFTNKPETKENSIVQLLTDLFVKGPRVDIRHVFIDEAQEAPSYYLDLVQNASKTDEVHFHLFGDINQKTTGNELDDWEGHQKLLHADFHQLQQNYRNTIEITKYYNWRMKMEDLPIGISGPSVKMISYLDEAAQSQERGVLIVKNREILLNGDRKWWRDHQNSHGRLEKQFDILSISEVKGLEFKHVVACLDGMSRQEQYIALTRSLYELYVLE